MNQILFTDKPEISHWNKMQLQWDMKYLSIYTGLWGGDQENYWFIKPNSVNYGLAVATVSLSMCVINISHGREWRARCSLKIGQVSWEWNTAQVSWVDTIHRCLIVIYVPVPFPTFPPHTYQPWGIDCQHHSIHQETKWKAVSSSLRKFGGTPWPTVSKLHFLGAM